MFLLLLFLESMKIAESYLPIYQSSAGGSQPGAAKMVQCVASQGFVMCADAQFSRIFLSGAVKSCVST
jgi:hypothetical protein